jgi:hypothetical protein
VQLLRAALRVAQEAARFGQRVEPFVKQQEKRYDVRPGFRATRRAFNSAAACLVGFA